jgi:hypothetical protein
MGDEPMLRLFHVSEEPGITLFEPRPVPSPDAGITGDAVWAIDEEHLPNYLLPRDCPRVTYTLRAATSAEDRRRFFDPSRARRIIVLEEAWRHRLAGSDIYLYEMPAPPFAPVDASAGYYIARHAVKPISSQKIADPLAEIAARKCEVRWSENLRLLHEEIRKSTLDFSTIRLRNAAG